MQEISVTALMPMKAHSERLPDKNIKMFHGKPLYHAVLDSLIKSIYIKEIIINTDIEEILSINALHPKVTVLERPEQLRGDYVPFFDIIEYDMSQTESKIFLQTHATNPILKTETVDDAILTFSKKNDYDSLMGVNKHQKRAYSSEKLPINHVPHDKLLRTQDLEPIFIDNSCIYIFSKESFVKAGKHRLGQSPYFFEMDEIESIDIDDGSDFILAEKIFEVLKKKRNEK
jgi:CMP-N-acetylneuraminic acid synthetase